jgi:hypothetical protein
MWKKWKQWTAVFMELLFGPPLEDREQDPTDDEIEQMIEEADDYGIYNDYYEQKCGSAERFGAAKRGNDPGSG